MQETNYNSRNVNQIPIGNINILLSLGAVDGVLSILFSITSTGIQKVQNLIACSYTYSSIKNQTNE